MSTESESGIPEGARNFKAPDSSERVEDVAKAQTMAEAADTQRSLAAYSRRDEKRYKNLVGTPETDNVVSHDQAAEAVGNIAKGYDAFAEKLEAQVGADYDLTKNMEADQFQEFLRKKDEELATAKEAISKIGGTLSQPGDFEQMQQRRDRYYKAQEDLRVLTDGLNRLIESRTGRSNKK